MNAGTFVVFIVSLGGCGRSGETVFFNLALGRDFVASDIGSLELTVAEGHTITNQPFSCGVLGANRIVDQSGVLVPQGDYAVLSPTSTTVSGVGVGKGLVVVLDAYSAANGLGDRIGHACADNVTIQGGKTTSLNLSLAAVQ